MATVWLARLRGKRGFEKLFAVKTIRTELVDDPRFQEMFLDEARIASGIQHPNVAQILDLGEQNETLFIVMEWVDGDSLAKVRKLVTKRGHRLPVGVVLRLLADACAGLHAAHDLRDDKGEAIDVVHRDVSPQNILVSTTGSVKVIDFGIAKAQNRKQGETRTGVVKGKIQYMAPEQVKKGRTVDRRADIWALGVCLLELVSGKLPYDGDDDIEVINKLLSDEAPKIPEGLPEAIVRILERTVVLDPDARFPTAAGMQRAVEAAMKELGESTTSEDVAAFLRSELPELAQKRREIVSKAVEEARDRGAASGSAIKSTPSTSQPEEAFAPTVMSERQPRPGLDRPSDAGTVALVKKKDSAPRKEPPPATAVSVALDQEPIVIPKTSKAWLYVLLVLVAGGAVAAYQWPAQTRELLARLGIGGSSEPGLQAVPVPMDSTGTSAPGPGPALAPAPAPAPAPASAPALAPALASASASAHPAASASAHPEPSNKAHLSWPHAGEASAEPAPSATVPWSPYKTAPATSTDNPYQGAPPL
jgi:serine/threonine-protein kinase